MTTKHHAQVRIHTGFHRSKHIGQISHDKYIFNNYNKTTHTQTYGHPLLSAVLTYKITYNSLCKNLFMIMKFSMDQLSPE